MKIIGTGGICSRIWYNEKESLSEPDSQINRVDSNIEFTGIDTFTAGFGIMKKSLGESYSYINKTKGWLDA
ncbi:MAG TPA: hypothetical protein VJ990_09090 [Clostridia bacterium]|nr:hypothetical protein [Clostridia bacterium]